MGIALDLSSLALGPLVEAACQVVGARTGEALAAGVTNLLAKHFGDQSARLASAIEKSNDRAWKALEIALAGDSFWERCKITLSGGDQRAFRAQVQDFLDALPVDSLPGDKEEFRGQCGQELRKARKAGVLTRESWTPDLLAKRAAAFARFDDPGMLLKAQRLTLEHMARLLSEFGYPRLAQLLTLGEGPSLLVLAARYFLRRAIEEDRQLFQGLAFARLEALHEGQEQGFAALDQLLREQGDRLESLLSEVGQTVEQTHSAVLDVRQELHRQGEQNRELYQAVLELQARFDLARTSLRPSDSLSIRDDNERRLVRDVIGRYRRLPEDQRRKQPALLNAIGKLETAAGAFEEAEHDFATVAGWIEDPRSRAEAHANAYRAALEQRNWPAALRELVQAVKLDGGRFAPFPLKRYRLQRILGAGGSGVAFLCEDAERSDKVVVKTLLDDSLENSIDQLFTEAEVLSKLDHRGVVRLRDYGYTNPAESSRPYLVMEHFDGKTLEEYIGDEGTFSFGECVAVARQIAEALRAAHQRKILHRDVKPANILVRDEGDSLHVQLIDFGLALRQDSLRDSLKYTKTLVGASIAGTLEYAAPEQLGRLPGVKPGPYSDIYGFGRTCCYALFGTTQPTLKHWESVPRPLAELLGHCLGEKPAERPADFVEVLRGLDRVERDMKARGVMSRVEMALTVEPAEPSSAARRGNRPSRPSRSVRAQREPLPDDSPRPPLVSVVAGLPVWLWGVLAIGLVFVLGGGAVLLALLSQQPQARVPSVDPRQGVSSQRPGGRDGRTPNIPSPKSRQTKSSSPRLIAPAVTDPDDRKVYLSDLPEFEVGSFAPFRHFGKNGLNGDTFNNHIVADGKGFSKALSMVPPPGSYSTVKYLVEPADYFQALAGFDDTAAEKLSGDYFFEVLGDGKSLWKSKPQRERGPFIDCRVKIQGVRMLELRVYAAIANDRGNAVWLDPYITRPSDYKHPDGVPPHVVYLPPQPTKWPELVGYWSLDEGKGRQAADSSENQREAELINAEWVPGIRGKAVRFLGAESYLDYGKTAPINFPHAGSFTLAFWMKTTQKDGTLLSQRNNKSGAPMIDITLKDGRVKVEVRQDGKENDRPVEFQSQNKFNDGQWHHIALTRKVGLLELFVDAAPQERKSGEAAVGTISTDICTVGSERHHIKTRFILATPHFEGCIDELCIFNRVLEAEEIAVLAGRTREKP